MRKMIARNGDKSVEAEVSEDGLMEAIMLLFSDGGRCGKRCERYDLKTAYPEKMIVSQCGIEQ